MTVHNLVKEHYMHENHCALCVQLLYEQAQRTGSTNRLTLTSSRLQDTQTGSEQVGRRLDAEEGCVNFWGYCYLYWKITGANPTLRVSDFAFLVRDAVLWPLAHSARVVFIGDFGHGVRWMRLNLHVKCL